MLMQALPIADSRDAIIRMLVASNVLVVAGDTGCGKSTQLPQYAPAPTRPHHAMHLYNNTLPPCSHADT